MVNNKTEKPIAYYSQKFAASDPEALALRSGISFADGSFHTVLMGKEVTISWPEMELKDSRSGMPLSASGRILLGRLLLEGVLVPSCGQFRSYKEMPWGSVYETQFSGRCIRRLAATFGNRTEDFIQRCEELGGGRIPGADAAAEISFLPGLLLRLFIWEGDEEFPASAQILFSDNFPAAFTAEDIAVVGDVMLNALSGRF